MRPLLPVLLLLAGCTAGPGPSDTGDTDTADTSDTADSGDSDTGATGGPTERFGARGTATVVPGESWTGTTTVYDEVVDAQGTVTESLCLLTFASTGAPADPPVPCADCLFAFDVTHIEATGREGSMCDTLWPEGDPGTNPAYWDVLLGYDPTGWQDGPALMLYTSAWTDSDGTFHAAGWTGIPGADEPHGGATWDEPSGAFAFDRPLASWPYGVD